jgi:hypothetical protein
VYTNYPCGSEEVAVEVELPGGGSSGRTGATTVTVLVTVLDVLPWVSGVEEYSIV